MIQPSSGLRPALWLMVGRAAGFIFTFAVPVVLVRVFDPASFGTYRQLMLLFMTIYAIAQFGMAESLFYFLPRDPERAGRYAVNALIFLTAAGLLGASLLILLRADVARLLSNDRLAAYIPLLSLYLFLMTVSSALEIVLIARHRYRTAAAAFALSDAARALGIVLPALLVRDLTWMLAGAAGAAALRCGAQLACLRREISGPLRPDGTALRRQLAYTIPFGLGVPFGILQAHLHHYAVAHAFGPALFAVYAVGSVQLPFVDVVTSSTGNVMMVRMSERLRDGGQGPAAIWHETTQKLALALFPVVGWALVAAPHLITVLFSDTYRAAAPIFMIWSAAIACSTLQTDGVLRVYARTNFALALSVGRLVVMVALLAWLLPVLQLQGAALAGVLVVLLDKAAALAKISSLLALRVSDLLPWRRLASIGGAAGAAAFAALMARDALDLAAFPALVVISLLFAGVYLGALWVAGLDASERHAVSGWLKRQHTPVP